MSFGGTLVIRNMLKIALAILASLVKFQDCLHCLEARTDFVFFLLATNTRQLWLFFTFFSKISSWHKIQVMALLRQAVRSVAQAGCFQTSAWWVFFSMQSTFCHSSSFLAGPCPACSSTRPCVVSITTVFLGSTSLHLIPIKSAIVVCWQYRDLMLYWLVCLLYPLEFAWLRWLVPCSCVIIGYACMQCIITGWTTYIF